MKDENSCRAKQAAETPRPIRINAPIGAAVAAGDKRMVLESGFLDDWQRPRTAETNKTTQKLAAVGEACLEQLAQR